MAELSFTVDLHCHPQYKPFARGHVVNKLPAQGTSPSQRSSLWHYNPPKPIDKLLNYALSVTKFSQMNLTAALYGRVWVMVFSMGSIEKFFFKNKLGTSGITDLLDDFAAEFGATRINTIEGLTDYWVDFQREVSFMESMDNEPVRIDGHWYTYRITTSFAQLHENMEQNELFGVGDSKLNPIVISLIPSVEGLHILNCGLENPADPAAVIANARSLKAMKNAPWFVTFSHHFYNELCGHARSLRQEIGKLTNQEEGINSGFTELGLQVLEILLDKTEGRRILIDIKHMSPIGRQQFREIRKTRYNSEFPIIISHGVCNGLPTYGAKVSDYPELGNTFISPVEDVVGGDGEFKDHNLINFYDDEVIDMVKSEGIMGLQLDERRLANEESIKKVPHSLWRNKIMHYRSELAWKQIRYIGELLDNNGLYAWGNIAIGSDYDGLVDPLNGFWTAEQYDDLAGYIERHAFNYFRDHSDKLKLPANRIKADKLVQLIFHENAWNFLKKWL